MQENQFSNPYKYIKTYIGGDYMRDTQHIFKACAEHIQSVAHKVAQSDKVKAKQRNASNNINTTRRTFCISLGSPYE